MYLLFNMVLICIIHVLLQEWGIKKTTGHNWAYLEWICAVGDSFLYAGCLDMSVVEETTIFEAGNSMSSQGTKILFFFLKIWYCLPFAGMVTHYKKKFESLFDWLKVLGPHLNVVILISANCFWPKKEAKNVKETEEKERIGIWI